MIGTYRVEIVVFKRMHNRFGFPHLLPDVKMTVAAFVNLDGRDESFFLDSALGLAG